MSKVTITRIKPPFTINCTLCGRLLNNPTDELSEDLGGAHCRGCMGEAEASIGGLSQESLERMKDEWRRGLRPNWTPPKDQNA